MQDLPLMLREWLRLVPIHQWSSLFFLFRRRWLYLVLHLPSLHIQLLLPNLYPAGYLPANEKRILTMVSGWAYPSIRIYRPGKQGCWPEAYQDLIFLQRD